MLPGQVPRYVGGSAVIRLPLRVRRRPARGRPRPRRAVDRRHPVRARSRRRRRRPRAPRSPGSRRRWMAEKPRTITSSVGGESTTGSVVSGVSATGAACARVTGRTMMRTGFRGGVLTRVHSEARRKPAPLSLGRRPEIVTFPADEREGDELRSASASARPTGHRGDLRDRRHGHRQLVDHRGDARRRLRRMAKVMGVSQATAAGAVCDPIVTRARTRGRLILAVNASAIGLNVTAGDQYVADVLPSRMFRDELPALLLLQSAEPRSSTSCSASLASRFPPRRGRARSLHRCSRGGIRTAGARR